MNPALPLPITGALIAGGQGRRLGGIHKAELRLDGERLLDRSLRFLRALCSEVLLLDGGRSLVTPEPVRRLADPIPDRGAPGAVLGALEAASHPWLFALGADMPWPSLPHALALWEQRSPECRAALYVREGRPEPLFAFYAREVAAVFRSALAAGPCSFVSLLRTAPWTSVEAPVGDARFLANANTPEDLARLGLSRS
jgi:molybdopterin-guanine dinucleotide biosynthesis protein A